jgi:RND family efflux transporter MFP subunit
VDQETQNMSRKWLIGGGSVMALCALALAVWALTGDGAAAAVRAIARPGAKASEPPPPLEFIAREVIQPTTVTMAQTIEFSGALVAPNSAVVRAKAAGTLLALNVAEGSRVNAGQLLGRIDVAELTTRLAERNANLESARAALSQAERQHASNERLAAQAFISASALDTSLAAVETARAQFAAAKASLATTQVGINEAVLVAPISGIVAKRLVVPGEKVSIEQQLLTLVDLQKLELAATVGTHEVSRLSPGMAVSVQVEGMPAAVVGKLARIAPAAEAGTRAIGVTVELANPAEALRAGQYAVARVEIADDKPRLSVPISAVGNTAGQDHVWVIADGALMRRSVTLGRRDDAHGRIEILTGVTADAQILATRFESLREGGKALVVAARTARPASAAASH